VPTGAAPASLIPVVAVVFICGLSDVLINEYLFIYNWLFDGCFYRLRLNEGKRIQLIVSQRISPPYRRSQLLMLLLLLLLMMMMMELLRLFGAIKRPTEHWSMPSLLSVHYLTLSHLLFLLFFKNSCQTQLCTKFIHI